MAIARRNQVRTSIVLFIGIFFISSCKNGKNTPVDLKARTQDSVTKAPAQTNDSEDTRATEYVTYEEIKHLDLKNYFISLQKGFYNIIIVRNKKLRTSDTLQLETPEDINDCEITDLSDSLHFKLCVEIAWTGDSDIAMSEFIGYWQDSLRTLFTLANVVSLRRKNDWTLTGFDSERDEVVYGSQDDYPITISLKDFSVTGDDPPVQGIQYATHANENLKGQRLTRSGALVPYTIRKGTDVLVDTIYRKKGIVRLVVSDSIIIYTPVDSAHEKLQVNAAG